MEITTLGFLIFLGVLLWVYYWLPQRFKWICLLLASLLFAASYKPLGLLFLLLSAWTIWQAGKRMEKNYGEETDEQSARKKNRRILRAALILNLGVLIVLKYVGTLLGSLGNQPNIFGILVPLGLSYYTLQAIGYVMDVYWKKTKAESTYLKVLLFLSYFPQMLQGPISRHQALSRELFEKEQPFRIHNVKYGVQLMLWGYFKVMVVGNRAAEWVSAAFFGENTAYGAAAFFGLACFGIQLYANFSGGIDVVRGVSQCFGIDLPENFSQPFFSRSLAEFWRRWHITLGTWMKDYVFFPCAMSRPVSAFKKKAKKHIPKKLANRLAAAAVNVLVFLLVGIWHGTGGNYVLWGLYNGLILAFSEVMADVYRKSKNALHIETESRGWRVFSLARTFFVVTLGWCTDCAATAGGAFRIIANMAYIGRTNLGIFSFGMINTALFAMSVFILLAVDICHERKISIRQWVQNRGIVFQLLFWTVLIQLVALFAQISNGGEFLYANF